jgi:steroid 5-alpha reductase family enzyme
MQANQPQRRTGANSLGTAVSGIAAALLVATLVVWLVEDYSAVWQGWPVFTLCALLAFGVQWIMFIHAWFARTEHFYDLTGSITYLAMIWFAILASGPLDYHALLLAALITIWALRLGPFLFRRVRQAGEDKRFRSIKTSFPTFLMTWTLQGLWVFLTASCALAAITHAGRPYLGAVVWLGLAMWVAGFAIEVIADQQKTTFRNNPENTNKFIREGLWAWSRHPNYFGEILLWTGIAVIALPELKGGQYITLISPVFVGFLLTKVSGVRMLEARADKQWGNDADYQAYKRNTPTLMLRPPRATN